MVQPLPEDKAADLTAGQTQINVPSPDSITAICWRSQRQGPRGPRVGPRWGLGGVAERWVWSWGPGSMPQLVISQLCDPGRVPSAPVGKWESHSLPLGLVGGVSSFKQVARVTIRGTTGGPYKSWERKAVARNALRQGLGACPGKLLCV